MDRVVILLYKKRKPNRISIPAIFSNHTLQIVLLWFWISGFFQNHRGSRPVFPMCLTIFLYLVCH